MQTSKQVGVEAEQLSAVTMVDPFKAWGLDTMIMGIKEALVREGMEDVVKGVEVIAREVDVIAREAEDTVIREVGDTVISQVGNSTSSVVEVQAMARVKEVMDSQVEAVGIFWQVVIWQVEFKDRTTGRVVTWVL